MLAELRRWGNFKTLALMRRQQVAPTRKVHIIERSRHFAPMTRKLAARKLATRDGEARRRIMARAAGVKGMTAVPKWSCDPIRCPSTRGGGGGGVSHAVVVEMPSELAWVDRALRDMAAQAPLRAMIVRIEFTDERPQKDRASEAQHRYGGELTFWQYRKELDRAVSWLIGWRSAAAA